MTAARVKSMWPALALVAGAQLAVLLYMVWDRVTLLQRGREVVVDVVPVDPRDIFRGDYVILGYPFSVTQAAATTDGTTTGQTDEIALPKGLHVNAPVYVTLAPDGTAWKRVAISAERTDPADPSHVVLKGRVDQIWETNPGTQGSSRNGRIRYGIEQYFVPEGTGHEIEAMVREKKVRAVLAVATDGTAALKALEVDGKRIHEQPVL